MARWLYHPWDIGYIAAMHEMSVAQSLLEMAITEARAHNCTRIIHIKVEYGAIAGIMPDALMLCFEALTKGTPHEGARLELIELPLKLRCPFCGEVFGGYGQDTLWQPCPKCSETFGHIVEQGRELILSRLEATRE